jgi:peptide/nickel transport system substrate-binding protein
MRKKHVLSLFMLVLGVALLAAATTVAGASAHATKAPSKASAAPKKGGTLRLSQSNGDFDAVDPGLAYVANDWALDYVIGQNLVNFPEKNGQAGSVIYPEAATAFPTVSGNGKTYVFHIRPGLKFSDGSAVTAAAFQRAFERNLSPKMGSPYGVNDQLQNQLVGGVDFLNGKTQHISGITAKGLTLTIHLVKPNPTFTSELTMQWFMAVKPNMPYTTTGENTFPSSGPYYIASRDPGRITTLKRNPYYKGSRPANPDEIVITSNTNQDQALLQTKANQTDLDIATVPATAAASLGSQYGVNKGRFFVGTTTCVDYLTMNTARPIFGSLKARLAANWGIDRPALLRILGKYAGKRTDQILVPGIPGYKPYHIYAFAGANVAKAKQIGGSALHGNVNVIHSTSAARTAQAQIIEYNLKQMGFSTTDVPTPATVYYNVLQTRGTTYDIARAGWCADYFDPFDYINVQLDGRSIQDKNNANMSYLDSPKLDKAMDAAARLSGTARSNAYAALDKMIMTKYAPWVPYDVQTNRFFVSARVHNWVYSNYLGYPAFNALSVG